MTTDRKQIPDKYKWDMTEIYKDIDAFEKDFSKAEKMIEDYKKHNDTMLNGPEELYDAFEDYFKMARIIEKLYEYAARSFDTDTSVNAMQALSSRVMDLFLHMNEASYALTPNLLKLDEKTLEKWYSDFPALKKYRRNIDFELRRKPHTLSDECEKLLAKVATGVGGHDDTYSILTDCDMTFGKIRDEDGKLKVLTDTNYIPFEMSQVRRVRKAAFNKLYEGYSQYGNTIATIINNFIKENVMFSKVRGYGSALECSTFEDEVTPDIYNNLIKTVKENLSVLFDYYELKRQFLGVPKLHMYDLYPPLVAECDTKYTYEQAVEEVLDTVKIFGKEYYDTLSDGLKNKRWVDVFPNDCKRGGAYSAGCYDTEPRILMNFNGTFDAVSTLAHESGHSMHSYMSRKYNDVNVSEYKIFVAEVASTVNELLLAHKKLRESKNDSEKLSVLNQLMETFKGTLFRQTMFADFEKQMYEAVENGEILTKEFLSEKYYTLVKEYFGPDVVCDKPISYEWMRIPHFYYNFYVYKYATCISAAAMIVKKIENEGETYIKKYIDFLKCGGSKSPLESLKVAEVDMESPEVIKEAISVFGETLSEFKALAVKNKIL